MSKAFGTALNRDELMDIIVTSAIEVMKAKAARLFLLDEEEDRFVPVAQRGLSEKYVRYGLTHPTKIIKILQNEGHLFSYDSSSDERLNGHDIKKAEGIASILVVPVLVKGKAIGGLSLFTSTPRYFTQEEIDFVTAMAEQGGMAIEHGRLFGQMKKNTSLFLDLAININSSLDMKTILHILTAEIAEALKVKASSLLLINEKKKTEGFASLLSVPIKTKEKVIGVLRLYSGVQREFSEDEVMLVTALAYLGGLAIQNSSLYLMLESDMKELKEDMSIQRPWF